MKSAKSKLTGNQYRQREKNIALNTSSSPGESLCEQEDTEFLGSKESLIKSQELAHLGSWEWDILADKITWSPELYHIYDIDPKTQLGYDKLMERIHPDDREYHNKIVDDWMKNGRGGPFEYRILRPDGSIRFVHGRGEVSCDDTGKSIRMFGILQDVTERKLVEEKLEKYKLLFSKANDLAYICDTKQNILYLNEAFEKLSGHKVEEYTGRSFAPLFDAENLEIAVDNYSRTLKGESPQYEVTFKDTGIICEYKNHPLRDEKGNFLGVLGIARDITERKQAEKLIQRKNQIQTVINEILSFSLESLSLEEILKYAIKKIVSIDWLKLKSQGAIFLVGENSEELYLKTSLRFPEELKKVCSKISVGKCLCGLAVSRKKVLFANYLDDCHKSRYVGMAPHAHYCVPIQSSSNILGVLNLYVEVGHQRNKDEEDTLQAMANVLAAIIKRKQAEEELDKYRRHLEKLVKERTVELTQINNQLKKENAERKDAEEKLRKSEEKYHSLINNIPSVTWISDSKGNTIFISPNVRNIYGYTPEEIYSAGESLWFGRIHPEDIDKVRRAYAGLSEKSGGFDIEYRIKKKDGEWMWLHDKAITTYEKEGTHYIYGVFTDITERKNVEAALISEKDFTESALNAQIDTFFVFNPMDGKPLRWNKVFNEVSGYSDEEIRSMTPNDFYRGEDLKHLAEATQKVLHEGKANVEFSLVTKSGKCIPYEYSGVLIKDPETDVDYVCAIGRDITERKRAEEELKARQREIEEINATLETRIQEEIEKNRQKDSLMMHQSRLAAMGEMVGNISHQWKQPLNALNILLYNIYDFILEEEQNKEQLSHLIEQGNKLVMRMSTTIEDFRSFFKPNKRKEKFSINKIIKDSLKLIHNTLQHSNISVILNEESEITAFGFPNEYSQVLLNIIKNAKDAIEERGEVGEIKMDVLHKNNFAIVRIKDNGGGISKNTLEKIFDPYFTTKDEKKASGIGLYMSKVIIEKHMNGHITAQNSDNGAVFEISTPMIHS